MSYRVPSQKPQQQRSRRRITGGLVILFIISVITCNNIVMYVVPLVQQGVSLTIIYNLHYRSLSPTIPLLITIPLLLIALIKDIISSDIKNRKSIKYYILSILLILISIFIVINNTDFIPT